MTHALLPSLLRRARRHLLTINDLSDEQLQTIVGRGLAFARSGGRSERALGDHVVGIYFCKTSTRTRIGFSAAALRLGAQIISIGPNDLQTNTGETIEDTGRVLSHMLDALVVRTAADPSELRLLARQDRAAIINAMTLDEHPTQALADLTTLLQQFGSLEGRRVLYVGEGNNTAVALCFALARFRDTRLHLRTPPGFGLPAEALEIAAKLAREHGALVEESHSMADLPPKVEVVYTTRWQTTGTTKPVEDWRTIFAPYKVDQALMDRYREAWFMHDLPAHRGEDVDASVLEGPRSIAFQQAENKLYSAMAVLEWCVVAGG
jgi:ornithine carbamoyltransferase